MKIIILIYMIITVFIIPLHAGPGHDHGNTAFEQPADNGNEIELTEHQIKNLKLETALVKHHNFFETIKVPVILNTIWYPRVTAQGFLLEGSDILKVKSGLKGTIKLDILPDKTFQSKISQIDDMIDPRTRLYSIFAAVESPLPPNRHGVRGEMVVQTTPLTSGLGVPAKALQGEFGGFFVFVKKGNHFERRQVVVGHRMSDIVEIKEGLEKDEEVVTTGAYQLRFATGTPVSHDDSEDDDHHKHHSH